MNTTMWGRWAQLSVAIGTLCIMLATGCDDRNSAPNASPPRNSGPAPVAVPTPPVTPAPAAAAPATPKPAPVDAALLEKLRAPASRPTKDGIAAIVLVDTSGSMSETVRDTDGREQPKIDIARRAAESIVRQVQTFAKDQPNQPTLLGLYDFSDRTGQPACRPIIALSAPDPAAASRALRSLKADGNTPIGEALVQAKQDLDRSGLSRLHVLIITDGQNTRGVEPGPVMRAIGALPEEQRPGVYFVAFDVAASVFSAAKDAGALVLPAANAKELQEQLDFVMGNKILIEK